MDRDAFFRALRRSRLLDERIVEPWSARFGPATQPATIASALVADAALTPYQAARLLAGRSRRLTIGPYRILDEIGRGGMGQVYKALHTVMDRVVALKVMAAELINDDRSRNLFRREVRAATLLHHPNIVMAFDANDSASGHYLVMEYVPGLDLRRIVQADGPLPVPLACELLAQAARGLEYAHGQGLVHRDIKPANLLVANYGTAAPPTLKVLDFGLARLRLVPDAPLLAPAHGAVVGTPGYIAPEQVENVHDADIRSDLYSLGCTFYCALSGRVPFPRISAREAVMQEARPLADVRAEIPASLAGVVHRLMEKSPEQRYQSPTELLRAVNALPTSRAPRQEVLRTAPDPEPASTVHANDATAATAFAE